MQLYLRPIALGLLLAASLAGCKGGNSANGDLFFSGSASGELDHSPHIEFLQWKKPVHLRMAPATTFDVHIRAPKSRAAHDVASVSVDGDIATAHVLAPGLIRVTSRKPGEATIKVKVKHDRRTIEDALPLVVQAP